MNETNRYGFKKTAAALAVASCMSLVPMLADAAGLGKLTVLSGLGQPLRAELDIAASKEELSGMTAHLAPQEAFRQAGVDFASVLLDLRFSVDKRANGQSVVKVTSSRPINEPFLDFLVELNWPAGRLVREYTFLLDPPEIAAKQSAAPVAEARVVEGVRGGATPAEGRPSPVKGALRPAARAAAPAGGEAEGTRVVQAGETLRKIAGETKYDGVSLEQMLVGLFRHNPDAFIGQNVNRLKAGAILNLPDKASVAAVPEGEAKRIYVTQSGGWQAYRQKLAAATARAPAKEEVAAAQTSAGKITARVEEKAVAADQAKDQVKVARSGLAAKGGAAAKAVEAADQVAKDKALKEAEERLALLEKNVKELQKLLEMKNQQLADLQQPAKKEASPPAPPKTVEAAKAVEPKVEAPVQPVAPPKAEEAPKAAESRPVEPPKPAEKPKVVAPPPPPPPPEPAILDALIEDPLPLIGAGGILALLATYFVLKRRRERVTGQETTAAPMPSSLGPNSVFRMTGGQSIDTGNTPPQTGEFSQTGPGTIDTDEVDPVAEADVYMAYGRDTQAEEILLEAMQKDPQRTAIHAKLLEIYANRRSVKQFETLAGELYAQTGGAGSEWEKVALLGLSLDPSNPLYSMSRPVAEEPVPPVSPAEALTTQSHDRREPTMPVSLPLPEETPAASEAPLPILPIETPMPPVAETFEAPLPDAEALTSDAMTLDFDLGVDTIIDETVGEEAPPEAEQAWGEMETASASADALDFDLGSDFAVQEAAPPAAGVQNSPLDEVPGVIDFDLTMVQDAVEISGNEASAVPDFSPEGTMVMPLQAAAQEADVGLSTWVGGTEPAAMVEEIAPLEPVPEVSAVPELPLEDNAALSRTTVTPLSGEETIVDADLLNFDLEMVPEASAVPAETPAVTAAESLEFDVQFTDSVFLGQPTAAPEFDMGAINLDLSEPPATPEPVPPATRSVAPPEDVVVRDGRWEEANTKLDLAKAYEEMGDFEGARELLQEVVGDGPVDLAEQARAALARIGG